MAKRFKHFLFELSIKNTIVYHSTRKPFKGNFKESKMGSGNDVGYSGRGFYFFDNKKDAVFAAPNGYVKPFEVSLRKVYNLTSKDDPFSIDTYLTDEEHRDQTTLQLLKDGYDGSIRYLNGRIEEICVFSYISEGYDGNNNIIETNQEWEKI